MSAIRSGTVIQSFKPTVTAPVVKKAEEKQQQDTKSPAEIAVSDIGNSVSQAMASGDPPGKLPFGGSIKALEVVYILALLAESAKKTVEDKTTNTKQTVIPSPTKNIKENDFPSGNATHIIQSQITLNPAEDIANSYAEAITNNSGNFHKLTTAFQDAVEQVEALILSRPPTVRKPETIVAKTVSLPVVAQALAAAEQANNAGTLASEAASSASEAASSVSMQLYITPKVSTLALIVAREAASGAVAENYEAGKNALNASEKALKAAKRVKEAVKALEANSESVTLKNVLEYAKTEALAAAEKAKSAASLAKQSEENTLTKGQEIVETASMAENTLEDFTKIEERPLNEQLYAIDKLITPYTPANIKKYVIAQKEALIKKHLPYEVPMSTKNGEMRKFIDSFKTVTQDTHGFTFNSRVSTIVGELENYNDVITRAPDDAKAQLKILEKVLNEVKNFINNAADSVRVGWVMALQRKLDAAKTNLNSLAQNG